MVHGQFGLGTNWPVDSLVMTYTGPYTVWSSDTLTLGQFGLGILWSLDIWSWNTSVLQLSDPGIHWSLDSLVLECMTFGHMVPGYTGPVTIWSWDLVLGYTGPWTV